MHSISDYSVTIALMTSLIIVIISALMAIAFYTLRERKLLGCIQHRKGPNKPRIIAIAIPVADVIKLFIKNKKSHSLEI